jgi:hypothetical protein
LQFAGYLLLIFGYLFARWFSDWPYTILRGDVILTPLQAVWHMLWPMLPGLALMVIAAFRLRLQPAENI